MRRASLVLLALIAILGGIGSDAGAKISTPLPGTARGGVPSGFERHAGPHWTWYGPGDWIDSQGANDLYIGSPTGTLFLHYGASAAPCSYPPYYTSIAEFFKYVRDGYLQNRHANYDFYSFGLKSAGYTSKSTIRQIKTDYYHQVLKFRGRRGNGRQIKGEMVIDLFYVGPGPYDCGERQQVRSAPARGNGNSIRLLRKVQSLIFGPHE